MIDHDRISPLEYAKSVTRGDIQIGRGVVAVDPAVSANKNSNETGIIYAHVDRNKPAHLYVVTDATVGGVRPEAWAKAVIKTYKYHEADRVVGEVNNGGDLVESNLRNFDRSISYKQVRATKGKILRAEPVSALYEQHRVHHVGNFPQLEDQMTEYDGTQTSPDRLDALVWAATELIVTGSKARSLVTW